MLLPKRLAFMGIFAFAVAAAGCGFTTDGVSGPYSSFAGTLTVDYTIAGSTDPVLCSTYEVTDVELVVFTSRGAQMTEQHARCEDFGISVSLASGLYTAEVTLVDVGNRALSITKPLYSIEVVADTELVIDVDFPPDSMLY